MLVRGVLVRKLRADAPASRRPCGPPARIDATVDGVLGSELGGGAPIRAQGRLTGTVYTNPLGCTFSFLSRPHRVVGGAVPDWEGDRVAVAAEDPQRAGNIVHRLSQTRLSASPTWEYAHILSSLRLTAGTPEPLQHLKGTSPDARRNRGLDRLNRFPRSHYHLLLQENAHRFGRWLRGGPYRAALLESLVAQGGGALQPQGLAS